MRLTTKIIKIPKTILEEVEIINEELAFIAENKEHRQITVKVSLLDNRGEIRGAEDYEVSGDYYSLLMSANPEFAPNKLANEYRESDIWYIIDLINSNR